MTGSPSAFYLLQDVGGFGRPNERLGVGVVLRDVSFNGLDQLVDISKATASDLLLRDVSKEALDHVEPGSTGRSEVNFEPRMALQPGLHRRMFMRRVVVHDQMKLFLLGS